MTLVVVEGSLTKEVEDAQGRVPERGARLSLSGAERTAGVRRLRFAMIWGLGQDNDVPPTE